MGSWAGSWAAEQGTAGQGSWEAQLGGWAAVQGAGGRARQQGKAVGQGRLVEQALAARRSSNAGRVLTLC